jgi:hypothetical protein
MFSWHGESGGGGEAESWMCGGVSDDGDLHNQIHIQIPPGSQLFPLLGYQ